MTVFTRLILARHGRVDDRWRGKVYGDLDVPLAPAGEEQSRRVAALFRGRALDAVISSGLDRATFAARAIAETVGLSASEVQVDPRLREIHRGQWAGLGAEEVEALEVGAWKRWQELEGVIVPPGGESHREVRGRTVEALGDWARRLDGGCAAIVAHKWVLRVALAEALGLPDVRLARLEVPTSGLLVLDWPVGGGSAVGGIRVVGLGLAELSDPGRGM